MPLCLHISYKPLPAVVPPMNRSSILFRTQLSLLVIALPLALSGCWRDSSSHHSSSQAQPEQTEQQDPTEQDPAEEGITDPVTLVASATGNNLRAFYRMDDGEWNEIAEGRNEYQVEKGSLITVTGVCETNDGYDISVYEYVADSEAAMTPLPQCDELSHDQDVSINFVVDDSIFDASAHLVYTVADLYQDQRYLYPDPEASATFRGTLPATFAGDTNMLVMAVNGNFGSTPRFYKTPLTLIENEDVNVHLPAPDDGTWFTAAHDFNPADYEGPDDVQRQYYMSVVSQSIPAGEIFRGLEEEPVISVPEEVRSEGDFYATTYRLTLSPAVVTLARYSADDTFDNDVTVPASLPEGFNTTIEHTDDGELSFATAPADYDGLPLAGYVFQYRSAALNLSYIVSQSAYAANGDAVKVPDLSELPMFAEQTSLIPMPDEYYDQWFIVTIYGGGAAPFPVVDNGETSEMLYVAPGD